MRPIHYAAAFAVGALLCVGCNKTADNTENYKSAINAYYNATPSCVWATSKQFPVQVAASDTDQTAPYAALVDAGLLVRSTSEKRIVIVDKRETNYDLSDVGRSAWTPDPSQPGAGNFCYGHRSVSSIDSSTPNSGQPGATSVVVFHYSFSGAPAWAQNAEVQNAFPQMRADLNGNGTATKTLVDTSNGWQVKTTGSATGE
jgi:hypothetical protein